MEFWALTRMTWRNLWRNKRRTLITCLSVACYTFVLIVLVGLIAGFSASSYYNITHVSHGDAQLHAPGFMEDRSLYKTIENPDVVLKEAAKAGVRAAKRGLGVGLVSVGKKSAGGSFIGVDSKLERDAFSLFEKVSKGEYLSIGGRGEVVLGSKLARSLHASVGSEVIAVVQAADGSMGNELFRVVGILESVAAEIDRGGLLVHKKDFDDLFMTHGKVHELAFNSFGKMEAADVVEALKPASPDGDWSTWNELLPAMSESLRMNEAFLTVIMFIFSLAASLGTMNTMLMATYDRVQEFGVIRALGASPWRIIREVSYEAMIMGALACTFGAFLGVLGGTFLEVVGIDLSHYVESKIDMAGVSIDMIWRAKVTWEQVALSASIVWAVCVLSSLYPALKASRLKPVTAMNHV